MCMNICQTKKQNKKIQIDIKNNRKGRIIWNQQQRQTTS